MPDHKIVFMSRVVVIPPGIITEGNISPNPPSGESINDKYYSVSASVAVFRFLLLIAVCLDLLFSL